MISFTLNKTEIRLDFSFFAAVAIFVLLDRTGQSITALAACITHEMAHLISMWCFSVNASSITFYAAGISVNSEQLEFTPFGVRLSVYSAGAAMNIIVAVALFLLGRKLEGFINLFTGLINLLPIGGLDGARILDLLLIILSKPERIDLLKRTIFLTTLAAIMVLTLIFFRQVSLSLVISCTYLLIVWFISKNSKQTHNIKNV